MTASQACSSWPGCEGADRDAGRNLGLGSSSSSRRFMISRCAPATRPACAASAWAAGGVARRPRAAAAWSAARPAPAPAVRRCPAGDAGGRPRPGPGADRSGRAPAGRSRRPGPASTARRWPMRPASGWRRRRHAPPRSAPRSRPVARAAATSRRPLGLVRPSARHGDGQVRQHGATVSAALECRRRHEWAQVLARAATATASVRPCATSELLRRTQIAAYGSTEQPAIAARMAPHLRLTQIGTGLCAWLAVGPGAAALATFPSFTGRPEVAAGRSPRWSPRSRCWPPASSRSSVWRRAMASWRGMRPEDLHAEARLSWIAHLASYAVAAGRPARLHGGQRRGGLDGDRGGAARASPCC